MIVYTIIVIVGWEQVLALLLSKLKFTAPRVALYPCNSKSHGPRPVASLLGISDYAKKAFA